MRERERDTCGHSERVREIDLERERVRERDRVRDTCGHMERERVGKRKREVMRANR